VNLGDQVQKGSVIAKVGTNEGRRSWDYLHFEIRKGYSAQNPYFYLP
jgi:murein DD-endopeptidase MepM/ murein hydrolase activator NlpD